MTNFRTITVTGLLALFSLIQTPQTASADGRHYYSTWTYAPQRTYYVNYYYYKPIPTAPSYRYHHCYYYPSQPRYVYYYNPYKRQYWGRYDLQAEGENVYSELKPEDRKSTLNEIPEEAFPKPAKMPTIPETEDGLAMLTPPAPPKDKK